MNTCSISTCFNRVYGHGWCNRHWRSWRRHGDPERVKDQHGKVGTPVYRSWGGMVSRCTSPTNPSYPRYGGRGITVCPEWMDFRQFYADMGDPPAGTSIERLDNDGPYSPDNCRWATPIEQNNNRRANRHVNVNGERLTWAEAARRSQIPYGTLAYRIKAGWSIDKIITTPVRQGRYKRRQI